MTGQRHARRLPYAVRSSFNLLHLNVINRTTCCVRQQLYSSSLHLCPYHGRPVIDVHAHTQPARPSTPLFYDATASYRHVQPPISLSLSLHACILPAVFKDYDTHFSSPLFQLFNFSPTLLHSVVLVRLFGTAFPTKFLLKQLECWLFYASIPDLISSLELRNFEFRVFRLYTQFHYLSITLI